jgi:hypothetical protein
MDARSMMFDKIIIINMVHEPSGWVETLHFSTVTTTCLEVEATPTTSEISLRYSLNLSFSTIISNTIRSSPCPHSALSDLSCGALSLVPRSSAPLSPARDPSPPPWFGGTCWRNGTLS